VGTYVIQSDDEEEFGALPAAVTITDINNDVNVPDIIFYSEETGEQISGEVNNPGGYAKTGYFDIMAFKAGTMLNDPNVLYAFPLIAETEMENAGTFSLTNLPSDINYDIYLWAYNESSDIESAAVRDSALNVPGGTTNVRLEYNSEGSTISGAVKNINGRPVLGAAILTDSLGIFKGFSDIDSNGVYTIYNVPAGNYTITAVHSKYNNASTTVNVVEGIDVTASNIVMPFDGSKEGPDLNGNGVIDLFDIAEFSRQWLDAGVSEANFNHDGIVNFYDWLPLANNWLWKAIWLNE
jgi:hypothetical protein